MVVPGLRSIASKMHAVVQSTVLTVPKLKRRLLKVRLGGVAKVRPDCCDENASAHPPESVQLSPPPSMPNVAEKVVPLVKRAAMLYSPAKLSCVPRLCVVSVAASTTTLELLGRVRLATVLALFSAR